MHGTWQLSIHRASKCRLLTLSGRWFNLYQYNISTTYIQVRGKKTMVQMMVKYMDACEYDLFPTTSKTVSSSNRPRLAGNSVNSFSRIDSTCRVRQSPTWHPPKTEIRHVIYTCRPKRRILKTFFSLLLTVSGISARWFLSMLSISSDFM